MPGWRVRARVPTVAPSASRRSVAVVSTVDRTRTDRSIVSPTRAPSGASTPSTSTSPYRSPEGSATSRWTPAAAAASTACWAAPAVSLPSERSTSRCWAPAGAMAVARRTAAPMSVAPTTGTDSGVASSAIPDGRRSTRALPPKTTTPAVSPCGMSRTAARAAATSAFRVASTMLALPSTRNTTLSRSAGSASRAPARTAIRQAVSTRRRTSDAIRRAPGSCRAATSQPPTTTSSAGSASHSQAGSAKPIGISAFPCARAQAVRCVR